MIITEAPIVNLLINSRKILSFIEINDLFGYMK